MKKLYYIFLIINKTDQPIPAKKIKQILFDQYQIKIDIKTIYQAIENLNDLFYLFRGKKLIKTIRKKGYCIEEEYFDDGQLQYLLDSILFNKDINEEEVKDLMDSLTSLSSTQQLSRITIHNQQESQNKYHFLLNLTTIIKAIHEKKNIYFKYVNYEIENNHFIEVYRKHGNDKNNKEFYILSPYKIIQRDSKYYLLGYFSTRKNSISVYRLDRMRLVRNHKSPFIDIQEQYDFEKELDKNVNMYVSGYRDNIEIRFHYSIIREIADHFQTDCYIKKTIDDDYILEAEDVLISEGLIGWLMMLQDKVEVIRPLQLKEEMIYRIQKMNKLYQKNA
ncbi:MAG: helix-turn-helix transcriptional regulator [Faecalibacillus sp.]